MADDELGDLSDMSRLGDHARAAPAAGSAPASGEPSSARWWSYGEPAPTPSGSVRERPAAAPIRRGGGGPVAAAVLVLLVLGAAGAVVALTAGTSSGPALPETVVETTASPGPTGEQITPPPESDAVPVDLFGDDLVGAYEELLGAAGQPDQILELAVYETYAFLAYRDPASPGNVDRRQWRGGEVGPAEPNPIDDRADEATLPDLFSPTEIDPSVLEAVVLDAPSRYDLPVEVTHVIVDRFLPFDERVLIRVYASPSDGRSGGGYVSYDTAGSLVRVCC